MAKQAFVNANAKSRMVSQPARDAKIPITTILE